MVGVEDVKRHLIFLRIHCSAVVLDVLFNLRNIRMILPTASNLQPGIRCGIDPNGRDFCVFRAKSFVEIASEIRYCLLASSPLCLQSKRGRAPCPEPFSRRMFDQDSDFHGATIACRYPISSFAMTTPKTTTP